MSTVITGGLVFDGTGAAARAGEVVIDDERITEVRTGHHPDLHDGHDVIDATGCTVIPGLIESHAHLTFPSAVGHIDPSFNPPFDVSFFQVDLRHCVGDLCEGQYALLLALGKEALDLVEFVKFALKHLVRSRPFAAPGPIG